MCSDCLDEESGGPGLPAGELAALARAIERDLPGDPAPEEAWAVYLGEATGALGWRALERLGRAMEAARVLAAMASAPLAPEPARGPF